ncbi:MAG: hypothetical protein JNG88_09060 [Phycisphaerales bacterium]|nr:hypothetical protein [Phycisphaerales bacterium]
MRGLRAIVVFSAALVSITCGCDQSAPNSNANSSVSPPPAKPTAESSKSPPPATQPSNEDLNALRSMVKNDEKPGTAAGLPPGHPPISGGDAPKPAAAARPSATSDLKFDAPMDWKPVPPRSAMRKAQYAIPKAEGDGEDAEVLIFYFGPGEGGRTADNLARWRGQFTTSDGKPLPDDAGKEEKLEAGGHKVSILDVTGRYAPGAMPGAPDTGPRDNFRMIAAVIETPSGPWFVKVTGPAKTMEANREAIRKFVTTAQ